MANDNRVLIGNYFRVFDTEYPNFRNAAKFGSGFLIIGGLLFYFQSIGVFQNVQILATVMMLIGVASFWLWLRPFLFFKRIFYSRPSDADMDIWFINDLHEFIKPRALEHLQINERSLKEENIIFIPYPVYWNHPEVDPDVIMRRSDDDGLFTYTVWTVQMLVVTEKFVSYYSCIYNWPDNEILDERTNEYFFEDIASVRNDVISLPYNLLDERGDEPADEKEKHKPTAKVFQLTNMSGDSLTLITEISELNVPDTYVNNLEKLVKAMRVLLRNRRYGEIIEYKEPQKEMPETSEENEQTEQKPKAYFHQQLREMYEEYSADMAEKRNIVRGN
jgi:hypothetical protein